MDKFPVVAVLAVKGRLPLLKYTVERLLKKNGCAAVVCVGDSEDEQEVCEAAGAKFVYHANEPLGAKWNAGFIAAKEFSPQACLFVGSSDWVSDNWLPLLFPKMETVDLVGKADFHMIDFNAGHEFFEEPDYIRICHWHGYGPGRRENEPIGIGRLISARILEKMAWRPFDPAKNSSLDWSMYTKVQALEGNIELATCPDLVSLSVSTNRWSNMHKFEDHWCGKLPSDRIEDHQRYYSLFPELKLIFA